MVVKGASLLPKSKVDGTGSKIRGQVSQRASAYVGINLQVATNISRLNYETKMITLFAYDSMICRNIGIIIWIFLTKTEEEKIAY